MEEKMVDMLKLAPKITGKVKKKLKKLKMHNEAPSFFMSKNGINYCINICYNSQKGKTFCSKTPF